MILSIQRYSTHDSPGIHTIVFLKGCSLGYHWCRDPESHAHTQDLLYDARLCLEDCELCAKATPEVIECALDGLLIHRKELTPEHLTALTDCCPTQALTVCGEMRSVEEIITTVLHDEPFYDHSDGGLTPSGDEPFMQPEMTVTPLQVSHEVGTHTVVETRLRVPWKYAAPSLPYIDLFFASLKRAADAPFKQWAGGNAARVLDSLKKLAAAGKKIIIYVPLIQGFNADETSVEAVTSFAAGELYVDEIHFLPYHTLGINRYHLLNLSYNVPEEPPDAPKLLDFAQQYVRQRGLAATLRG